MNSYRVCKNTERLGCIIRDGSFKIAAMALLIVGGFIFVGSSAWAGPPFFTDDPEPVEHFR